MIDTGVASGWAVVSSAGGLAVHRLAGVIAQTDVESITPWADAGATVIAFSALAYLGRLMASGRLMPADTNRREELLTEAVHKLTEMVEQSHAREDRSYAREERLMALLTHQLNPGDRT